MKPGRVLVIGGGLAGLATASALAESQREVTLMESRPRLGGRATSFPDSQSGVWIDNCQHVTMGCCTNLARFCDRVGIAAQLHPEPVVYFQDEAGRVSPFRALPLPAPLHLAPSLLGLRFLSWREKFLVTWGSWCLLREPTAPRGTCMRDWLLAHGQTDSLCERYWGPFLISALNETLDQIDYRYGRQVFVEGFCSNRRGAVISVPRVPLEMLYGMPLEEWLCFHGVSVRRNEAVARLTVESGRVVGCETRAGARVEADDYVLAIPFQRIEQLLPPEVNTLPEFAGLRALRLSPITSVHLWYDRPVMEHPNLVPVGRVIHWLFNKHRDDSPTEEYYLQAVISASRHLATRDNESVANLVSSEIRELLPRARDATLRRYRVVSEKNATFSVAPGVDDHRPAQTTSLANLYLAGDYTRTGWPATMESAVRSGYLVADTILRRAGESPRWVCPDLPRGWLARCLVKDAPNTP